jgi:large subunit ribosomal protein L15
MKLHDLRPAEGSRTAKTRVGRGIAAGKGKTAGRGTKGQKSRSGGSIPPWFEGGQTPLHMRIPKLRGFRNPFRVEYEVVNVGAIAAAVERGAFESGEMPGGTVRKSGPPAQITINQDLLRAVGLVRTLKKPLKILGHGEVSTPLFVVADAFTASARSKIEAAGGTVTVLEVPSGPLAALGIEPEAVPATEPASAASDAPADGGAGKAPATRKPRAAKAPAPDASAAPAPDAVEADPSTGDDA